MVLDWVAAEGAKHVGRVAPVESKSQPRAHRASKHARDFRTIISALERSLWQMPLTAAIHRRRDLTRRWSAAADPSGRPCATPAINRAGDGRAPALQTSLSLPIDRCASDEHVLRRGRRSYNFDEGMNGSKISFWVVLGCGTQSGGIREGMSGRSLRDSRFQHRVLYVVAPC